MDNAAFRTEFPELSSSTDYPDATVTRCGVYAEQLVDDERWGDMRTRAVHLVAAHFLTLGSFGAAAVSNDTSDMDFNTTGYGRQYHTLARLFCAGGLVV